MRLRHTSVVYVAIMLLATLSGPLASEAAKPKKIAATYDAGLAGITLGTFKVNATLSGKDYSLTATGKFSLMAGLLYKATGTSTSRGKFASTTPRPARYSLAFQDTKKRQKMNITFKDGTVRDVVVTPKKRADPRLVPIPEGQLSNVLDPLTAAFLSIRSNAGPGNLDVCNQTIRIFDGRQRFDLKLSPKRLEALGSRAPKRLSKKTAVCGVRYQPIGGYRPEHDGVKFMQEVQGVEVWLANVAGTDIYLPYKVIVPTAWGSGSATMTGLKATPKPAQRAEAP